MIRTVYMHGTRIPEQKKAAIVMTFETRTISSGKCDLVITELISLIR